jgi:NADH-quinone oxidoreductase E subunit
LENGPKEILSKNSIERIVRLKDLYPHRRSAILMVLHIIYDQFGHIDKKALEQGAVLMELPLIDFEQASSFYTLFPNKPVGKYHIQVCRTLSCHLRGAMDLTELLKKKLGIELGEVTPDGLFSLVEVECLGSCGTSPVLQINESYYENINREHLDKILSELKDKAKHE